jgi:hypothetical protein
MTVYFHVMGYVALNDGIMVNDELRIGSKIFKSDLRHYLELLVKTRKKLRIIGLLVGHSKPGCCVYEAGFLQGVVEFAVCSFFSSLIMSVKMHI